MEYLFQKKYNEPSMDYTINAHIEEEEKRPEIRVLLMHGLDGSNQGYKSKALELYFNSFTPDMKKIYLSKFNRIFKNPYSLSIIFLVFSSLFILGLGLFFFIHDKLDYQKYSICIALFVLETSFSFFIYKFLKRKAVRYVFENCLSLQQKAIEDFKPDIIVGSSFGGALAIACISNNFWNGPTLLLAPAQSRINEISDILLFDISSYLNSDNCNLIVFHGTNDESIPVEHSQLFFKKKEEGKENNNNFLHLEIVKDVHDLRETITYQYLYKLILFLYGELKNFPQPS